MANDSIKNDLALRAKADRCWSGGIDRSLGSVGVWPHILPDAEMRSIVLAALTISLEALQDAFHLRIGKNVRLAQLQNLAVLRG